MKGALWTRLFKMKDGQPEIQTDQVGAANLPKIAQDAGLDVAKLKTDMASDDCGTWLQENLNQFKTLGASATPTFFINGHYSAGAMSFEELDKMVGDEIARADKAIAGGVTPASFYDREVVAKGSRGQRAIPGLMAGTRFRRGTSRWSWCSAVIASCSPGEQIRLDLVDPRRPRRAGRDAGERGDSRGPRRDRRPGAARRDPARRAHAGRVDRARARDLHRLSARRHAAEDPRR
jgi:hypothetical protein